MEELLIKKKVFVEGLHGKREHKKVDVSVTHRQVLLADTKNPADLKISKKYF